MRNRLLRWSGVIVSIGLAGGFAFVAITIGEPAESLPPPEIGHLETPDDAPADPVDREERTSARAVVTFGPYRSVQVNVNAAGNNVLGDAANEPTIAVDPNDPSRITIGWRQFDNVNSNFRQAGRAYSQDGGETWTFPGVLQPGIFRSDPVLDYDADGVFYYNSLRSDFTCQYFISGDGGQSWSQPIESFGGDKQWSAIDRTSGVGRGNVYLAWSPAAGCCGNRLFTRSTNGAATFMQPITLPGSPMWGTLAVAPNGNLFISGRAVGGLAPVLRSTNAKDSLVTPTFTVSNVNLGGDTRFSTQPNPGGLLGQVWIACEPEGGPRPDNVYLLASVDPPSSDPLDVMFVRSTNGGQSWSIPVRVNDDPTFNTASQWFATMAVAPNGRIDAVWADTRVHASNTLSQLYFSTSHDGGETWTPNEPVSPAFDPSLGYPNQNKLGDYYHMYSDNGFAYLAYAATFTGGQDVYFLRIPIDCNENGVLDPDDIAAGTSLDCNSNGVPDECERDCDVSGVPDNCELVAGTAPDCNGNGVPDSCDIADGEASDCNVNGAPDACESAALALTIAAPQTTFVCTDDAAQFTVSASGATGYQWRFEGQDLPGADGPLLTIDPVLFVDEGEYDCVVSFGCITAVSGKAELRVIPPEVSAELLTTPLLQTCTQTGVSAAAFVVGVDDDDGALYQWSKDGVEMVDDGRISGAQSWFLNVVPLQPSDGGVYTCRVWNTCMDPQDGDEVIAEVAIIDPDFVAPPAHTCAEAGGMATFTAEVASPFPIVLRWYEGDALLSDGGRFSGTTTKSLHVADVTADDLGRRFRLRAVVADPFCSKFSPEALLLVQPAGGCAQCPAPGDLDGDGDYDLLDLQRFTACFGADVGVDVDCACANVAGTDQVVDLDDWVLLREIVSGPGGP
jgi:hypothetical protein